MSEGAKVIDAYGADVTDPELRQMIATEGMPLIAEIVGPSGRVHYRRPVGDSLIGEALRTPGYRVRYVTSETVEPERASP